MDRDAWALGVGRGLDAPYGGRRLEEPRGVRPCGVGEQDLGTERRQQLEQTLGVSPLVEDVGGEHDVPGRLAEERRRVVPVDDLDAQLEGVSGSVLADEPDRVGRPVGREDVGPDDRRRERGQAEAAAELDDALAFERQAGNALARASPLGQSSAQ